MELNSYVFGKGVKDQNGFQFDIVSEAGVKLRIRRILAFLVDLLGVIVIVIERGNNLEISDNCVFIFQVFLVHLKYYLIIIHKYSILFLLF